MIRRALAIFAALSLLGKAARVAGVIAYLAASFWLFWYLFGPRGWAP